MKYDIRISKYRGLMLDEKAGTLKSVTGTKFRYRKHGSRGRFQSFVVVGSVPDDITPEEIVAKYAEDRSQ